MGADPLFIESTNDACSSCAPFTETPGASAWRGHHLYGFQLADCSLRTFHQPTMILIRDARFTRHPFPFRNVESHNIFHGAIVQCSSRSGRRPAQWQQQLSVGIRQSTCQENWNEDLNSCPKQLSSCQRENGALCRTKAQWLKMHHQGGLDERNGEGGTRTRPFRGF
jgi:hypothetical protein